MTFAKVLWKITPFMTDFQSSYKVLFLHKSLLCGNFWKRNSYPFSNFHTFWQDAFFEFADISSSHLKLFEYLKWFWFAFVCPAFFLFALHFFPYGFQIDLKFRTLILLRSRDVVTLTLVYYGTLFGKTAVKQIWFLFEICHVFLLVKKRRFKKNFLVV